jgi:hypothetical protein
VRGNAGGGYPLLPAGAVIAADNAVFAERLPETCSGRKVDPAALENTDFTYVAAGWIEALP